MPVLIKEGDPDGNPWGISFMTMFHMSNDSHLFHTREELGAKGWTLDGNVFVKEAGGVIQMLPLYEAKMLHHYDTRWATYEPDGSTRYVTESEKADEAFHVMPRYWVAEIEVDRKLAGKWDKPWLLGWRDITNTTNARTVITTLLPRTAVGNKVPIALTQGGRAELQACWSSFAADFVARQKIGGTTMNFFIFMQLPMPSREQIMHCAMPLDLPVTHWIGSRVDRLNARPTRYNQHDRAIWRAELDALACHLYGLDRDEVDYILETFPIVRRQEEARHGEYRTKRLILAAYDAMTHVRRSGSALSGRGETHDR